MKISFSIILGFSLLLTSCGGIQKTEPVIPEAQRAPEIEQEITKNDTIPTPETSARTKNYTANEVAKHSVKDDCWLILDNGVYDVTPFIPRHPGGDKILRGCGKDATEMFAKHPESAKAMKEQFKIGDLAQ